MNVLIACEESQRVCTEFRKLGHNAFSCDIVPCSGGHPEWHIQKDVIPLLNGDCTFHTADMKLYWIVDKWDLIIAFPPCTYLSNVATRHHSMKCSTYENITARTLKRIEGMKFFIEIANADCEHIAIENPVGIMNSAYRKPDQIIQPYYFAETEDEYVTKRTCLWLKNLPVLTYSEREEPVNSEKFGVYSSSGKSKTWEDTVSRDPVFRSKTFMGVAKNMAKQWSEYLMKGDTNE